jgi:hypothetical protein
LIGRGFALLPPVEIEKERRLLVQLAAEVGHQVLGV